MVNIVGQPRKSEFMFLSLFRSGCFGLHLGKIDKFRQISAEAQFSNEKNLWVVCRLLSGGHIIG
jgi:hypothetical protein